MKKINLIIAVIIATFIISSCKSSNQKGFVINGEIEAGVQIDTIFVYKDFYTAKPIAWGLVKDNKFIIKGEIDTLQQAIIGNMQVGVFNNFVLENSNYTCSVSPEMIIIKGGKINNIVFGALCEGEGEKLNNEYLEHMKLSVNIDRDDEVAIDKFNAEIEALQLKMLSFYNNHFIKVVENKNPAEAKVIALSLIENADLYPVDKKMKLLAEYEKEIGGNHPLIYEYKQLINKAREQAIIAESVSNGKYFKSLIATDRDGKLINLEDIVLKNNYTLLEFWASWCAPCRAEIPNLKTAYNKYKSKGFEIFSLSVDQNKADWISAIDKEKTTWINTIDHHGFESESVKMYGITGIPSSFLISKDGIIVASSDELRDKNLDKVLSKLLQK